MVNDPPKRTDVGKFFVGLQPANHVAFDIKNTILAGLRKNQFDGNAIRHPCEHISHFYETCTMCRPDGVTNGQIKLRLFNLTLIRREKYWLQFLSNGTFHT